jgi:nicotinamide-nucleotide amidase
MIGEIIAIGDELTSGRILNSTSYFAASQLFGAGHEIIAMSTIGDSAHGIGLALQRALDRSDFVIVTGGLGATSDDLTNEAVAGALDRPVTFYPEIIETICAGCLADEPPNDALASQPDGIRRLSRRELEKLAWLPEGSVILKPGARMAGYMLVHQDKPIFFLPGVPFEMKELLVDRVIPYLAGRTDKKARHVNQKVYKVFGLPEVEINRMMKRLEGQDSRIRIGYYPVFPEVHVNLSVFGETREENNMLFQQYDLEILNILNHHVYGADDESLETVLGFLLRKRKQRVTVAESCTGGLVSHKFTKVPGSSEYYLGGVVAYSNELKERLLHVSPETLREHGAVSGPVARAMAQGALALMPADYALSVTGIAGPDGGSREKPVGTVYIGLATRYEATDFLYRFAGNRWQIQALSSFTALDLLRRKLLGLPLVD